MAEHARQERRNAAPAPAHEELAVSGRQAEFLNPRPEARLGPVAELLNARAQARLGPVAQLLNGRTAGGQSPGARSSGPAAANRTGLPDRL